MKKILLIRFSSIGDIVLTSPVIRCIKTQLTDVELHVLTKPSNKKLYLSNPYVDKVFVINDSYRELIHTLRKEDYDFVVDLHKNLRSFRIKTALHRASASFPKLNFKKLLLTTLGINRMPKCHIVDRYFEAVSTLGVVNDQQGLDYFISPSNELSDADIPEEFRDGFVAVVIGGQHSTKILPAYKVIEVCKKIDLPVILLGGPDDMSRAQIIEEQLGKKVGNPCGKLNLDQSASILKMSRVVLTNDTGLMHIAAALHKPIVSVWGNTSPLFGMTPYMPHEEQKSIIIENTNLRCHPCHKIGHKECPFGHFKCMKELNSALIAKAVNDLAEQNKSEKKQE